MAAIAIAIWPLLLLKLLLVLQLFIYEWLIKWANAQCNSTFTLCLYPPSNDGDLTDALTKGPTD
jgi:hypothetical protein